MTNFLKSILRILKSLFIGSILLLLVIFMINNREIINISFYPFPFLVEMRVFLLIIGCFTLGILFGFLLLSSNLLNKFFHRRKRHL
jgi:uncharacterized integral membrane protein